jgi:pimeloyl-ACP methyl ester carboxylesterase
VSPSPSPEEVEAFVELNVVPPRREEPRLADALVSVERQMVPSCQGPVAAWRVGDGPAVLLVHGYADDHSLWSVLIEALILRDRPLVALDLPAHGFSEGRWGLAQSTVDGVQAVAAALGPLDAVVSHSAGSGSALLAVHEGLRFDRAVLIAGTYGAGNFWTRHGERHGASPELVQAAKETYETRVGIERATVDFDAVLLGLDADVLMVHSTEDERFPFVGSEEMAGHHPRAEFVRVEGLSHRRTARDCEVVDVVADFVCRS